MYNTHWQIIDIHESFLSLSVVIIAQLSADNTVMDHAKEKNMEKLINNAPFALVLVFLVIGFILLIKGADFFVEGSSSVAKRLHVPSIIIGLTIVALGTSLPELVTSVTAARKGNAGIAIGNIVGSNIFNILFVIGTTALICTVPFESKFIIDTIIAVVVGAILWIGTYKHKELRRPCGIFMLLCYVAYFVYLCMM